MKIYKNPFVSRESYFVKTGKAFSYKAEGSKSKGYAIDYIDGKWQVREAAYYDSSLRNEMPMIAENNISIQSVIERAVLGAVLNLVDSAKISAILTEKVCTGKRCPMQVGYDVKNCKDKDCIYRTETEKGS